MEGSWTFESSFPSSSQAWVRDRLAAWRSEGDGGRFSGRARAAGSVSGREAASVDMRRASGGADGMRLGEEGAEGMGLRGFAECGVK